jgi:hypothetical protein
MKGVLASKGAHDLALPRVVKGLRHASIIATKIVMPLRDNPSVVTSSIMIVTA